jgi:hypothetical protein
MTIQVIKLVLQPEVLLIGHNLLYQAWTKRGLAYEKVNEELFLDNPLHVILNNSKISL